MKNDFKIYFVGNVKGMEYEIIKRYGYEFLPIPSYGFVGKSPLEKMKSVLYNFTSLLWSMRYIKMYGPEFIIGTGSFTELPVGFAAKLMKVPVYITEQDSYPGIATRLLSLIANRVFLSYETSGKLLKRRDNVSVIGTISEIVTVGKTKDQIKSELGISRGMKIVFVFGGSRGAKALNKAVTEMIKSGLPGDIFVIWQTGKNNFDEIKKEMGDTEFNGIILPFVYNMPEIYTIADLVVARAGACTLAELSDYRKAAILVPFPFAAHNHQMKNARYYEKRGAAIVIDEKEINAELLKKQIIRLIYNSKKLAKMGENSGKLHNPNAADTVVKAILRSK